MKWITLLFILTGLANLYSQESDTVYIHPLIKDNVTAQSSISCLLVLMDQGDLPPIDVNAPKVEKATQLFNHFHRLAIQSQKSIIDSLKTWEIPYHPFYIVNAIQVRLDRTTLDRLKDEPGLRSILPDFPLVTPPGLMRPGSTRRQDTLINWGISHIHADSVWEMGITGHDVVVAGLDTGVDWDHDFLRKNYRGYKSDDSVDHNYNWYDGVRQINVLNGDDSIRASNNPCGLSSLTPCDDNGHGTFTMGLMTGVHDHQFTGIAPGASWIGSRVMERGDGRLSSYLAGLEWCLAPTNSAGLSPRPDRAPDIINNSWACPRKEGCLPGNYWMLDSAAERLTQAGILVISSAGNNGRQGCFTLINPPAIFESVFTVGATDRKDSITDFSSRGLLDSSLHIKPEAVAPGKNITSIYPDNKFQRGSGTSISAPITAGVAALVLDSNPGLKGRPDILRDILIKSTIPIHENPCGKQRYPNPVYGYGRIDALKAVELALEYQPTNKDHLLPDQNYKIHPNPVRDFVYLSNKSSHPSNVCIIDVQGKVIMRFTMTEHETKKIAISNLNSGLHFVRIRTSEGYTLLKMLKI